MNRKVTSLILTLVLLSGALGLMELSYTPAPKPHYEIMLDAARRAEACFEAVRQERLARGYALDYTDDPSGTGLIGLGYSELTTTLGSLEAKRSTTNPNSAALAADLLIQAGLKPGDRLAVNLSGSFPALNIAVLCAADALDLQVVVISSVGASTYGANLPGFTWPDMEAYLHARGLLSTRSVAVSLGGRDDLGLEFPAALRKEIAARLSGEGYEILSFSALGENLDARMAHYGAADAFCNVGGNLLAFGEGDYTHLYNSGLVTAPSGGVHGDGLVQRFLARDVPVVHLLNVRDLFPAGGLPYDPLPIPAVGEGAVYETRALPPAVVAVCIAASVLALFILRWGFRTKKAAVPAENDT